MNESNHNPTNIEDLRNRLVEVALREKLGAETPPDLTQRVLAATDDSQSPHPTGHVSEDTSMKRRRYAFWFALAVAATLLVGATTFLSLSNTSPFKVAKFTQVGESLEGTAGLPSIGRSPTGTDAQSSSESAVDAVEPILVFGGRTESSDAQPSRTSNHFVNGVAEPESGRREDGEKSVAESVDINVRYAKEAQTVSRSESDSLLSLGAGRQWSRPTPAPGAPQVPSLQPTRAPVSQDRTGIVETLSQRIEGYGGYSRRIEEFGGYVDEAESELERSTQLGRVSREGLLHDGMGRSAIEGVQKRVVDTEGRGPGEGGDKYTRIYENPFVEAVGERAVSTFSIDVDTASYSNVRQFLMQSGTLPPPDAVRIEELVNYLSYDYAGPAPENEAPFAAHVEVSGCPWNPDHRLARIGIKGRELAPEKRPLSNLVFLIDVSGSMNQLNKLPLVVEGMKALTRELGENDRVAIVVYASSEGLVLPSTPGTEQKMILEALDRLRAGGSTAGGAGIQLAYQLAEDHFIEGGVNRVILCTDGDFNVGTTSTADLERLVEQKAKDTGVFLSVLGFGRGNLNDAMMEAVSGRGNGNYFYVDNGRESRKVLVEEMTGTLVTIAKDVKIQIFFNPAKVAGYRLLGYENRLLAAEDFNDDTKDAGEIGAGHTVTALYEIVPADMPVGAAVVDESPYIEPARLKSGAANCEQLMTLRMRYKQPDGDESRLLEWPISDDGKAFGEVSSDCKFAAAVAGFGMLLRDSEHKGNATWDAVLEIAGEGVGEDPVGRRGEFLEMVGTARALSGE